MQRCAFDFPDRWHVLTINWPTIAWHLMDRPGTTLTPLATDCDVVRAKVAGWGVRAQPRPTLLGRLFARMAASPGFEAYQGMPNLYGALSGVVVFVCLREWALIITPRSGVG